MLKAERNRKGLVDIKLGKNFGQYKTVWQDKRYDSSIHGKQLLKKYVPDTKFTFPKSVFAVQDCLYSVVGNRKEALVLDFFAGSGSTAHALELINKQDGGNRKYILIEQMDYVQNTTVKRMQSFYAENELNTSLIYCELSNLNSYYIDKLSEINSESELINVLDEMKSSAYLNFKVELNKVTIDDKDFSSFSLDKKKKVLIDVLDMNQLYLNYSEIDDTQYDISDEVKQFNHSFYGQGGE